MSRRQVQNLADFNRSVAQENDVSVGTVPWRVFRMVKGVAELQCFCGDQMKIQRSGDLVLHVCDKHPWFQVSTLFVSTFPVMLTPAYRPKIDLRNLDATDEAIDKASTNVVIYLEDSWLNNSQTRNNLTSSTGYDVSYMEFMMNHTASTFTGAAPKLGFGGGYSVQVDCRRKAAYGMPAGQGMVRIYDPTLKGEGKKKARYHTLRNVGVKGDGDVGPNFGVLEAMMDEEYGKMHQMYLSAEKTVGRGNVLTGPKPPVSHPPPAPSAPAAKKKKKAPVESVETEEEDEDEDEDESEDEGSLPPLRKAPQNAKARVSARASGLPYARP